MDDGDRPGAPAGDLERAVRAACRALGVREGEVSVALLDDDAITELGRAYLGRAHPTDVIAFALHEPDEAVLGDVYIGWEQARRQADELGVSLHEELIRLAVHGTLHVLGLDHPEDPDDAGAREESPMYLRQEALVREVLGEGGSP